MSKLPVDPNSMRQLEFMARGLFHVLDEFTEGALQRREVGIALFLFRFGEHGELTYISNAERATMIKTLMEFIAENPPEMTWDQQHG